ncbi:MAG: DUF4279 domain-containing protein [Syntrophobacteraceae bacterium]
MDYLDWDIFGENEACIKTNVSFRIGGESIDPIQITNELSIHPSRSCAKGDEYTSHNGRILRRSIGHWSISTEWLLESTSTEKHAKLLLTILKPAYRSILKYVEDPKTGTSIVFWWETDAGHGGFSLSPDTMKRLCKFCNDIEFHFIGGDHETEDGEAD